MNIPKAWRKIAHASAALAAAVLVAQMADAAPIAALPDGGRVLGLNPTTGQRWVASGASMPSPGYIATDPESGDIFVADPVELSIFRVSRNTGLVRVVSGQALGAGPQFMGMGGIAVEASGRIVVISGGVVRVDPATGDRAVVSSTTVGTGPNFRSPSAIAIGVGGDLLVTDYAGNFVLRIDAATGNRTIISGDPFGSNVGVGPSLDRSTGIAAAADGTLFVVSWAFDAAHGSSFPHLFRINAATGDRTNLGPIHTNFENGGVYGVAIATGGPVLVANAEWFVGQPIGGSLAAFDAVTGQKSTVSRFTTKEFLAGPNRGSGSAFMQPTGLAIRRDGKVLLASGHTFVIDRASGDRATVPHANVGDGMGIGSPQGVAALGQARLAITTGEPNIVQVDLHSGNRTLLSANTDAAIPRGTGTNFARPAGMALEASGTLIVADSGAANPKLVRVDPLTGNRTVVSSSTVGAGPNLLLPLSVAVEVGGTLAVADASSRSIVRVNASNGDRTLLSDATHGIGPTLNYPSFVVVQEDGSLAVADGGLDAIIRVDAATGNRTMISGTTRGSGPAFISPTGVVVETAQSLLLTDDALKSVLRVDRTTGDRTVVASATVGSGPLLRSAAFLALMNSDLPGVPAISSEPVSSSASPGGSASFSVQASGVPNLTYQWQRDGREIPGANGATLTLTNVGPVDEGRYRVVVTNPFGATLSAEVTLTVPTPPTIIAQPQARAVTAGRMLELTVSVSGPSPLSFQWYRNAIEIPGATSATFSRVVATSADAGIYRVVVRNAAGTTTSADAVVAVSQPRNGTLQFDSNGVIVDESTGTVTLNVVRSGGSDFGVSIRCTTEESSALSSADFETNSSTLVFADGVMSQTFTVRIIDNAVFEGTEVFRVKLEDAGGGALAGANSTSLVTVRDNDGAGAGSFSFAMGAAVALEDAGTARLTVVRTSGSAGSVEVRYRTIAGSAKANRDFRSVTGSLVFKDGEISREIVIPLIDDHVLEEPETFDVLLEGAASLAEPRRATVQIADAGVELLNPARGLYSGLWKATARNDVLGKLSIALGTLGAFTGNVITAGTSLRFRGVFDAASDATVIVPRLNNTPLTISIHVAQTGGSTVVSGQVREDGTAFPFTIQRAFTALPASIAAGKYTLILLPPDDDALPRGFGYAVANVGRSGSATLAGRLGDGTAFSQSSRIAADSTLLIYVEPYVKPKGIFAGSLSFQPLADSDVAGTLAWTKPAQVKFDPKYSAGFSANMTASGARYLPPLAGQAPLTFSAPSGATADVEMDGGNLAAPLSRMLAVASNGSLVTVPPAEGFSFSLTRSSGLFSGKLIPPSSGKRINFSGVVHQRLNLGGGVFVGATESGAVRVTPR